MAVPELDLVVFDMAGTTLHASDEVLDAFRAAFAHFDIELSEEEIRGIRGKSKRETIADLLIGHEGLDAEEVYADFEQILMERFEAQDVVAIDGAEETFAWLKSRNANIALNTGFDRAIADMLIRRVGWDTMVDAVVTNSDVPTGRPAPFLLFRAMEWTACKSVDRVAAVGDTIADLQAAGNAGVKWRIGVLSGAHSEARLRSYPHTAIVETVADLPEVL